eukprot:scaffold87336_cov84-Phaeocystis_antarctica.AAC.1
MAQYRSKHHATELQNAHMTGSEVGDPDTHLLATVTHPPRPDCGARRRTRPDWPLRVGRLVGCATQVQKLDLSKLAIRHNDIKTTRHAQQ